MRSAIGVLALIVLTLIRTPASADCTDSWIQSAQKSVDKAAQNHDYATLRRETPALAACLEVRLASDHSDGWTDLRLLPGLLYVASAYAWYQTAEKAHVDEYLADATRALRKVADDRSARESDRRQALRMAEMLPVAFQQPDSGVETILRNNCATGSKILGLQQQGFEALAFDKSLGPMGPYNTAAGLAASCAQTARDARARDWYTYHAARDAYLSWGTSDYLTASDQSLVIGVADGIGGEMDALASSTSSPDVAQLSHQLAIAAKQMAAHARQP